MLYRWEERDRDVNFDGEFKVGNFFSPSAEPQEIPGWSARWMTLGGPRVDLPIT